MLLDGRIVFEWYTPRQACGDVHLLFSITQSLVGCLMGTLVDRGLIDPLDPVTEYVAEIAASGFGRMRVRELLDLPASGSTSHRRTVS
jgi:hypothetical protein